MEFHVSTWQGHREPRHLVRHYLGVSVRVFWDEMNIWIFRLSEADCPPPRGWASSSWIQRKSWAPCEQEGAPPTCCAAGMAVVSCLQTGAHPRLSWGSHLLTTDLGISQPPALHEPIPYHKSLSVQDTHTHTQTPHWFCFSGIIFLCLFLKRKNREYNIALEIVFFEGCPLLNFLVDFWTQKFSGGQVSFTELQVGENLVTFCSAFKAAVVGNGHKEVAFLHSPIWVLGQQSLSGSHCARL